MILYAFIDVVPWRGARRAGPGPSIAAFRREESTYDSTTVSLVRATHRQAIAAKQRLTCGETARPLNKLFPVVGRLLEIDDFSLLPISA